MKITQVYGFIFFIIFCTSCLKKDNTTIEYYRIRVRDINSNPLPYKPASPMLSNTMKSNTLNFNEIEFNRAQFHDNGINYIITLFNSNMDSLKFVFGKYYPSSCNYIVVPYEGDSAAVGINRVAILGNINSLSKTKKLTMNEFYNGVQLSAYYSKENNGLDVQYANGGARTGPYPGPLINYTPLSFHYFLPLP